MSAPGRPPVELRRFVELVNRERYWESHEVLEEPWRRTGSEFYHGLILYASAFVHVLRGNAHGVLAQLEKAEERLRGYRPSYLGIDVEAVLDHSARCRREVEAGEEAAVQRWRERVTLPHLELADDKVAGHEPELNG